MDAARDEAPEAAGTPTTYGLLLCDTVDQPERDRTGGYSRMFLDFLREGEPGALTRDYDVLAGERPADIDECDAYLISGSRHGVYDDLPWIGRLCEDVRALHAASKPLVGICFGHQLVAQALGGEAGKSGKGWGLGVHHAAVTGPRAWMGDTPEGRDIALLVCHQDQVRRLPPGARRFLASPFCENAGYTVGDSAICLQGHPEFDRGYARYLVGKRGPAQGEEFVRDRLASLDEPVDRATVSRWVARFVARAAGRRRAHIMGGPAP